MSYLSKILIRLKGLRKEQIFSIIALMIPINIYIIGDFLGAGFQTSLFKFQISSYGSSFILVTRDLSYVISGIYKGQTALSTLLWVIGVCFLVSSIFILFLESGASDNLKKRSGTLIIIAGILFISSIIVQYGPFFHGPAGTAIPIGLPVLFVIGGWMYMEGRKEEVGDEVQEVQGIDEKTG